MEEISGIKEDIGKGFDAENGDNLRCGAGVEYKAEFGVAILGYGVVGKGVAYTIRHNAGLIEKRTGIKLRLMHVLDILDFPDSPDAALITHDVTDIMRDCGVRVVVETMGGTDKAFEYTAEAFAQKKHVVTSNKELVAERGPELLALAACNGVSYRFDASVGGGIPAIVPIGEYLAANKIEEITGILNGTTNYMLTHMRAYGGNFAETLRMAQENGYAEKKPEADIDGSDACRKLSILSSIAWDAFLDWKTVHTEGIANVILEDIMRASDFGCVLKLIARARLLADGKLEAYILPAMIDRHSPLANVEGVNNAILIRGDLTGDIMLYGQGAGMLPTGSAVVSDIIFTARESIGYPGGTRPQGDTQNAGALPESACAQSGISDPGAQRINVKPTSGKSLSNPLWDRELALETVDFSTYIHNYYVRIETPAPDAYRDILFREFPNARILPQYGADFETPAPGNNGDTGGETGGSAVGNNANIVAGADAATHPCAPMCIFTVPSLSEGEFATKLACVNKRVAGSATGFIARIFKTHMAENCNRSITKGT